MKNRLMMFLFLCHILFLIQSCLENNVDHGHNCFITDTILELDGGSFVKLSINDSSGVFIRPTLKDSGIWEIRLHGENQLTIKRLDKMGKLVQDIFDLNTESIHIKKNHTYDETESNYTLSSYIKWSELNSIFEKSNNLYATHILKSDTLEYMNLSYVKLFCLPFDNWKTIAEISVKNNNGLFPIFSGEIEDYRKIDFLPDCKGDWIISSIIKRVDTLYAPVEEDVRIDVIQDTIYSSFHVR